MSIQLERFGNHIFSLVDIFTIELDVEGCATVILCNNERQTDCCLDNRDTRKLLWRLSLLIGDNDWDWMGMAWQWLWFLYKKAAGDCKVGVVLPCEGASCQIWTILKGDESIGISNYIEGTCKSEFARQWGIPIEIFGFAREGDDTPSNLEMIEWPQQ